MKDKLNILTVIPARGGSKGIPQKNIRQVAGKPLIGHTIESALLAKYTNRVIVSTDDTTISDTAVQYGAEVIKRPSEISGDTDSSESALLHVLYVLNEKENYQPDILVFLQCTCPLTLPEDIDGAIQLLFDQQADTVFAITRSCYILWGKDELGNLVGINHDKNKRLMRQQCREQFVEIGAIYVMRVDGFLAAKNRFFGKTVGYELPRERFCDIDTPMDLFLAEQMMLWQKKIKE